MNIVYHFTNFAEITNNDEIFQHDNEIYNAAEG
jgi:hypothetical protein